MLRSSSSVSATPRISCFAILWTYTNTRIAFNSKTTELRVTTHSGLVAVEQTNSLELFLTMVTRKHRIFSDVVLLLSVKFVIHSEVKSYEKKTMSCISLTHYVKLHIQSGGWQWCTFVALFALVGEVAVRSFMSTEWVEWGEGLFAFGTLVFVESLVLVHHFVDEKVATERERLVAGATRVLVLAARLLRGQFHFLSKTTTTTSCSFCKTTCPI